MNTTDFDVDYFRPGDRVQMRPAVHDDPDNYGKVVSVTGKRVRVKLDKLLRDYPFHRDDVGLVEDNGDWK